MLTVHLVTSLCEICRGNIKANRSPYRYFATAVVEVIHIYIYAKKFLLNMLICLYFSICRYELHVIMDEIYMLSVYDDTTFTSVLSLDW